MYCIMFTLFGWLRCHWEWLSFTAAPNLFPSSLLADIYGYALHDDPFPLAAVFSTHGASISTVSNSANISTTSSGLNESGSVQELFNNAVFGGANTSTNTNIRVIGRDISSCDNDANAHASISTTPDLTVAPFNHSSNAEVCRMEIWFICHVYYSVYCIYRVYCTVDVLLQIFRVALGTAFIFNRIVWYASIFPKLYVYWGCCRTL